MGSSSRILGRGHKTMGKPSATGLEFYSNEWVQIKISNLESNKT